VRLRALGGGAYFHRGYIARARDRRPAAGGKRGAFVSVAACARMYGRVGVGPRATCATPPQPYRQQLNRCAFMCKRIIGR
jgi:hypothetical protein